MAKCSYCGSTLLFGGVKEGDRRFCNAECHQGGQLLDLASQLPDGQVREHVQAVHQGSCPLCDGPGPVDVHTGYRVWSAVILTSWKNTPRVSCTSCGRKNQLRDGLFSLLVGWWGFPWGLVMTPVQLLRTLAAMSRPPDPYAPSPELERMVRLALAAAVVRGARERSASAATDPITP